MWLLALQNHTPQNVFITPLPIPCEAHLFLTHLPHSSLQCPIMLCAAMSYSTRATSSPVPPAAPCNLLGWSPGSPAGSVGLRVDWACKADCCLLLLPGWASVCSRQAVSEPGCLRLVPDEERAILVSLGEENLLICCMMVGFIAI